MSQPIHHAACFVHLHECDILNTRSLNALARLPDIDRADSHMREIAINYGFIAGDDMIGGTDIIGAVFSGPNGIDFGASASTESALAIAALLPDEVFHETVEEKLADLPSVSLPRPVIDGRFDAVCMAGGVILELFDDYWPHRECTTHERMNKLTLSRFYALCQKGQSQHARLAFRGRAKTYIEERVFSLTVPSPDRLLPGQKRQSINFVEVPT